MAWFRKLMGVVSGCVQFGVSIFLYQQQGEVLMSVTVIVSRSAYDCLESNGQLFECLADRELVYVFSVRASNLPPKGSYKELHLIELRDAEEQLTQLLKSIQCRYDIEQVVYVSEQEVIPVAYAQQALGLSNLTVKKAQNFRDKPRMNGLAEQAGIEVNPIYQGSSLEELSTFIERYGKVVLKPTAEAGSVGVHMLTEAALAFEMYDPETMLIQAYNPNDLYHLDALVRDNQLVFSSLGQYSVPCADYATEKWKASLISNQATALHATATAALMRYLSAADVQNGVFHFEFFSDGDNLTLCEIAIRPGGGGIAQAIDNVHGINLFDEHIRWQLGLPAACKNKTNQTYYTATMSYFNKESGRFTKLDLASLSEQVNSIKYMSKIGQSVQTARNGSDELFYLLLNNQPSYHQLLQTVDEIIDNAEVNINH
ncbi:hypothetical protein OPW19_20650 [Vibrio europaeus]|nr:hypothetical protein [Vibrio europaeus]MDC5822228.1 hypothetical protein [Vibrio europaeus]